MSEVKEIKNACTAGERLSLTLLNVAMVLYFILVSQTVWNWFVADLAFPLTYWQMFLGYMIARFIVVPTKRYSSIKEAEEKVKKLSFSTRIEDCLFNLLGITFMFAVFFIINLIIAYYN